MQPLEVSVGCRVACACQFDALLRLTLLAREAPLDALEQRERLTGARLKNDLVVERFLPTAEYKLSAREMPAAHPHEALRCMRVQLAKPGDMYLRLDGCLHRVSACRLLGPVES